jgi:hypothetical protein
MQNKCKINSLEVANVGILESMLCTSYLCNAVPRLGFAKRTSQNLDIKEFKGQDLEHYGLTAPPLGLWAPRPP